MVWRTMVLMAAAFSVFLLASPASAQETDARTRFVSLDSILSIQVSAAAKYAQAVHEAPSSVTLVTSEDIERLGYQTLEDVLQMVRGFYTTNDRNYSYIGVRGFSRPTDYNDRIVVLLNGHLMNENVYGSALIGTEFAIDFGHVDRIEIVRGPGSALYGTNAMFAIINVITKDGNAVDGGLLKLETGSYRRAGASIQAGRQEPNGLDWSLSGLLGDVRGQDLYFPEYDDLATNHGVASNNDWDQYYGFAGQARAGRFSGQAFLSDRRKAVPTGYWEIGFDDDDAETRDARGFIEAQYESPARTPRHVMLRAYYDTYYFKGSYPYEMVQYDRTRGRWLGLEAQYRWDWRPDNRLTAGFEYESNRRADYTLWDADATYFDGNFPFWTWSAYLQDEAQVLDYLALTLGVRQDHNSMAGHATNPRAAAILTPKGLGTFKLMYGEAFRAPNIYEREIGSDVVVRGNPDLKAERLQTLELAWECRLKRNLWSVLSLYDNSVRGLIDQSPDPVDSIYRFSNLSRVETRGVEAELDARWPSGMAGTISYNYQRAENPDDDESLTNSPQHLVKITGSAPCGRHVTLGARGLYETRRKTVYDTWTPSYFLTGLNILVKPANANLQGFRTFWQRLTLAVTINNLFDTDYQTPGGTEHRQPAITQNGRTVLARVSCTL